MYEIENLYPEDLRLVFQLKNVFNERLNLKE